MAAILNSIARQYIASAMPVSSASIVDDCGFEVSSATIRNEMARLEEEGYIIRPHHAAGSIPSDKGYVYYAGTLSEVGLPPAEQRMIDHLFHQVEENVDEWLSLAVSLAAQRVQNLAIATAPRSAAYQLKHLELVALGESRALVILVMREAKVRQQLVHFGQPVSQEDLTTIALKLNTAYKDMTGRQILANEIELSPAEQQVTYCLLKMMNAEDKHENEAYIDGIHYWLNQPEFAGGRKMAPLVELFEQRRLVNAVVPQEMEAGGVQVIIGRDNRNEAVRGCSVVLSRYGPPGEARGTIGVIGPTRMPYARAISTVGYLATVMDVLVSDLYGRRPMGRTEVDKEESAG
jgi:heat-inducible transcriptional repressor